MIWHGCSRRQRRSKKRPPPNPPPKGRGLSWGVFGNLAAIPSPFGGRVSCFSFLISRIASFIRLSASSPRPCSAVRNSILPKPMPCSPVQVPPMRSRARWTRRSLSAWPRRPLRIVRVEDEQRWKLPSPTWPTIGASSPAPRCRPWSPGCNRPGARSARRHRSASPCAGAQRLRRPVGVVARLPQLARPPPSSVPGWKAAPPPCSAAISLTISDCSATPASVPWNSRTAVGVSGSQLRIAVDGVDLHLVEQFDARDRDAAGWCG
jgi:hypothetical protein